MHQPQVHQFRVLVLVLVYRMFRVLVHRMHRVNPFHPLADCIDVLRHHHHRQLILITQFDILVHAIANTIDLTVAVIHQTAHQTGLVVTVDIVPNLVVLMNTVVALARAVATIANMIDRHHHHRRCWNHHHIGQHRKEQR